MFERVEVNTFQRGRKTGKRKIFKQPFGDRTAGRRFSLVKKLDLKYIIGQVILFLAALVLGRAVLLGELFPFGIAFVAAVFAAKREFVLTALAGAAAGLSGVVAGWEFGVYLVALAAVGAGVLTMPPRSVGFHFLVGGTVFAVTVVTGTGYVAFTGPTTYEYVRVLFEAIFTAFFAIFYYLAFKGLEQLPVNGRLKTEEFFCVVLLMTSVVAGAGQLQWSGISPGGVLAGLVVMVAGYMGGAGLGASAGAVMGILPGFIFATSPAALGAFAFAGFFGGMCRGWGRVGVIAGFLAGNTLLTVYLSSGVDIAGMLVESSMAALILLVLPALWITKIKNIVPVLNPWGAADRPTDSRGENSVMDRVGAWGTVFENISVAYEQVSGALDPDQGEDQWGWRPLANEVKNTVCAGCPLHKVCWERELTQTERYMRVVYEVLGQKGKVAAAEIDEHFSINCSRSGELMVAFNCLYQLQRMNRYWESRLLESRKLVAEQLRGMRGVIESLSRGVEAEGDIRGRQAELMKQELKEVGLPVASLHIYPGSGDFEVEITMPCCGGGRKCLYDVAPLLSSLAGKNLVPAVTDCVVYKREEFCTMRLYPEISLRLGLGLASSTRVGNSVSGDSWEVLQLSDGNLVFMVSDGMGSGPEAAAESKSALALLRQLIKIGFNRELAVRILNSVMMCRLPGEKFATVDMCVVNLYNKNAEFIKIGAASSFFVRRNQVEIVKSDTLPVGIVDEISVFSSARNIAAGDMVVMVTDGVIDAYRDAEEKEVWITAVLTEIVELPAQEVADLILRLALSGSGKGGRVSDDMTVLVARVEKC